MDGGVFVHTLHNNATCFTLSACRGLSEMVHVLRAAFANMIFGKEGGGKEGVEMDVR